VREVPLTQTALPATSHEGTSIDLRCDLRARHVDDIEESATGTIYRDRVTGSDSHTRPRWRNGLIAACMRLRTLRGTGQCSFDTRDVGTL